MEENVPDVPAEGGDLDAGASVSCVVCECVGGVLVCKGWGGVVGGVCGRYSVVCGRVVHCGGGRRRGGVGEDASGKEGCAGRVVGQGQRSDGWVWDPKWRAGIKEVCLFEVCIVVEV